MEDYTPENDDMAIEIMMFDDNLGNSVNTYCLIISVKRLNNLQGTKIFVARCFEFGEPSNREISK